MYLPETNYHLLYKAFRVVCPANVPNTSGEGKGGMCYWIRCTIFLGIMCITQKELEN